MKGKTHGLKHDLTFSAHTINCVCHSIRSMFRVLGMYNFAIRSISLSQQHDTHYLTLILRNTSLVTLNITLQGRTKSSSDDAIFLHLVVECDTTGHIPVSEPLVSQVKIFQGGIQCIRRQNLILFWPPTYLRMNLELNIVI